jgi:hypothetical protein
MGLCLTRKSNERLWFGRIDIAKLLDLLSFAGSDIRQTVGA